MASCNDCIHNEICQQIAGPFNIIDADMSCTDFKHSARFVELPCKVGDTVYVIKSIAEEEKIIQDHVETLGIGYYADGINIYQWDGVKTDGYFEDFGKTVFLTREEAERALKEREKNAN